MQQRRPIELDTNASILRIYIRPLIYIRTLTGSAGVFLEYSRSGRGKQDIYFIQRKLIFFAFLHSVIRPLDLLSFFVKFSCIVIYSCEKFHSPAS